jgi:hypothetical protein
MELAGRLKFCCTLEFSYLERDTLHNDKVHDHTFFPSVVNQHANEVQAPDLASKKGEFKFFWVSKGCFE